MSRTNYVDSEGNTVLSVHLWEYDVVDCAMCEKETVHKYAVPWYCGPVAECENEGGYKCVCEQCYDKWAQTHGVTNKEITSR